MILGVGIDIIEVARIESSYERFGERFVNRILQPDEIRYCLSHKKPGPFLAARFAAKEAGMKAIGTGWKRGVTWQDFEVANLPTGKPTLQLHGVAAAIAGKLGVRNISLSLTHTAELGMAHVILED